MKTFCEQMLSRITTARRILLSFKLDSKSRRTIVTPDPFLAIFASSLLCACTGTTIWGVPVMERSTIQLGEQVSARSVEMNQSVLPWRDAGAERIPAPVAPEQAQTVAMAPRRGEGVSGDWQGMLSQESSAGDGSMVALGRFLRVSLQQAGTTISGVGEVSTGERLKISGTVEKGRSHGIVENVTYGMASRFVGTVADAEIVVHFTRGGGEADVHGVATLHRREN